MNILTLTLMPMKNTFWSNQKRRLVAAINFRKLLIFLAVAALTATAICHYWKPIPYYEKLINIQAEQELGHIDERITKEPLPIQAILLDYSVDKSLTLKAWLALSNYPGNTRNILLLYGSEPEFKEILRIYGEAIIPVIQHFLDNEVKALQLRQAAQILIVKVVSGAQAAWNSVTGTDSQTPAPNSQQSLHVLSSTERGWYAVNFIKTEGHLFLAEFVVDQNKQAQWVQTQRITNGLTSLFTSGVRKLEEKYVLKEEIHSSDLLFAGMDFLPLAVSLKILQAGKAVAVSGKVLSTTGKELSVVSRTKIFASRLIPKSVLLQKLGKYGSVVAIVYVVIKHPSLVNSLLAEFADLLGLNPLLVQFAGWFLIIAVMLYPFSWALYGAARAVLFVFSLLEKTRKQVSKMVSSPSQDPNPA